MSQSPPVLSNLWISCSGPTEKGLRPPAPSNIFLRKAFDLLLGEGPEPNLVSYNSLIATCDPQIAVSAAHVLPVDGHQLGLTSTVFFVGE